MIPVALTIAGSDSGGGAGIQADLLTFASLGVFGTSAITCLTAQNPAGVAAVEVMSPGFVTSQITQVASFFPLAAIKTGMLFNQPLIAAVAGFLADNPAIPVVVDPVMVATSGAVLLQPEAVAALRDLLLPLATVITPNLDEAAVLLGSKPHDAAAMRDAALHLADAFNTAVLLKGGHLDGPELCDVLARPDGSTRTFRQLRIDGVNTHGSGCTLASAIAAHLARGRDLDAAVAAALAYLHEGMRQAMDLNGTRYIRH
jgi:hydroxymethylpyrimidine/phosphomethylpyrimidine kinase